MDQTAVIIAMITGLVSIITAILQKRQELLMNKIDIQRNFISRDKELKNELLKKEKQKDVLLERLILLILDTNVDILKTTNPNSYSNILIEIEQVKEQLSELDKEISEIEREYSLIVNNIKSPNS